VFFVGPESAKNMPIGQFCGDIIKLMQDSGGYKYKKKELKKYDPNIKMEKYDFRGKSYRI